MLYFIYGEDSYRARKNARLIAENLTGRDAGADFYRLTSENTDEEKLKNIIYGQSLFGNKSVVVFDGLLESDLAKILISSAKDMSESRNVYVVLDGKTDAKTVKKISKFAQKSRDFKNLSGPETRRWILAEAESRGIDISPNDASFLSENFRDNFWAIDQELELKKLGLDIGSKKFVYSPFELADLMASKKPREAYRSFYRNIAGGVSAEEMFWRLWSQTRALLTVSALKESGLDNFQIKANSGLHPYVAQKSMAALSKFNKVELESIWDSLFALWRDAKIGEADMESGLAFILLGLGTPDKFNQTAFFAAGGVSV